MSIFIYRLLFVFLAIAPLAEPALGFAGQCRVMESRGRFIHFAESYGLTSLQAIENPFVSLQASRIERDRIEAKSLLSAELDRMGRVNDGSHVSESELLQAGESIGLQMLRAHRGADVGVIYGSMRMKPDGSVRMVYNMVDIATGHYTQKLITVQKSEARKVLTRLCSKRRCQVEDLMADQARYESAIKAVIGAAIAKKIICH